MGTGALARGPRGESDAGYKKRAEAVCATHAYAAWAYMYGHQPHKAAHRPRSLERTSLSAGQAPIRRWGKKRAGRLLDGRTWDEFPGRPKEHRSASHHNETVSSTDKENQQ